MKQPETVDAAFYAVIEPTWGWGKDADGRPVLSGAKVARVTQKRPTSLPKGGIVTRLTLRIDSAALLPLQPEAVIEIHPGQVDVITVEADSPEVE